MTADSKSSIRWRDLLILALIVPLILFLALPVLVWIAGRTVFYSFVLIMIWIRWLPRGKDTLVIYSESPHWQDYFKTTLIPALEPRCVTLNWSERKQWKHRCNLKRFAFDGFSGHEEFNPLVIVFRFGRWPRRFRFFKAFRDLKHRNQATIRRVLDELMDDIDEAIPYPQLPPRPSA